MFPSCLTVLPCGCSARRGPLGSSALHIWSESHTFPIWWASQALAFNCKALCDWVQLICMFVCLPAWAIGNPFPLLRERKVRQPLSGLIELATQGVLHYHAGLDVENALGWLPLIAAEDQLIQLFLSPLQKNCCNEKTVEISGGCENGFVFHCFSRICMRRWYKQASLVGYWEIRLPYPWEVNAWIIWVDQAHK